MSAALSADKSFRPKPIDITKQIPVLFRKEIESDEFSSARTVPIFNTGMEANEEEVSPTPFFSFSQA